MEPVRIAAVRYLNTAPLVEGLDTCEGITLLPVVPSRIADLVRAGEADIGLVSIVDAVREGPELALIPAGMIGCDGPTLTVRVFSSVPLASITHLHADTDSHTSVALARLILAKRFGISPPVIDFDVRERVTRGGASAPTPDRIEDAWPDSVLLIGDKVVTDRPPASRYPHELDLGEAWKELTGLPFVYAMWMCRAADADSARITTAATLLDRQRRHNLTRLEWIVSTRAPAARWPLDQARHYLGHLLRYQVGPREREAVTRFLGDAAHLGLLPSKSLRWVG
jgi:chorismate dehydratase